MLLLQSQLQAAATAVTDTLLPPTELDILAHYYEQDGNNSAVTGGTGTEELQDRSITVVLAAPLDTAYTLRAQVGVSYYSSASTDAINSNISSASAEDIRTYVGAGVDVSRSERESKGVFLSGSTESDYTSTGVSGYWSYSTRDLNSSLQVSGAAFFDRWQLFFPDELRGTPATYVPTDRRNTYTFSLVGTRVIDRRTQVAVLLDMVWQEGLLSTPFHRVYTTDTVVSLERLPSVRRRLPVALRVHHYLSDRLRLRGYYRFYSDDFGMQAHTASLALPIDPAFAWTVTPFYRYHTQSAVRYFAPYAEHSPEAVFATSDYDLSAFYTQHYGLSVRYQPLYAMRGGLEYIALRGSGYRRSNGLRAWSVGVSMHYAW